MRDCTLLLRSRHFAGFYSENFYIRESSLVVTQLVAREVLNEELDIVKRAILRGAAKDFVSAIDGIGTRRKKVL